MLKQWREIQKFMGLIREPIDVDFYIQSKPWTEKELNAFSEIIKISKDAKLA